MSIITTNKLARIRRDIFAAISGNDFDFTTLSLKRSLLLLSIPMVLEMAMESIFALVDIFFVSRLGSDAVAGVGITESMLSIVYALGVGLGMATTAIIARRIGEKQPDKASITAFQSIIVSIGISLIIAIPGILYAKDLLRMMGASNAIIEESYMYTTIILGGNGIIMMLFVMNSIFRSSGDAAISMRVLWLANIINIILDPCLIFGLGPFPEMGVQGAAIATSIGRGVAVLFQLYILFNGKRRVKLAKQHLKLNLGIMFKLIKLSFGTIGQYIIATSSWVIMIRIISEFGADVLAGYTIAIRIIIFAILPSWGLSNAAATMVGQNLGANQPERAEKAVWKTGLYNMIFMTTIGIIMILFSKTLMLMFINNPDVISSGMLCLQIVGGGFIFYSLGMVIGQSFNGAGDTTTPTIINLFCFWLLEIPLAYFLAITMGFEERGVFISIVIAEAALAITGIIIFRKGKWKERKV